MPLETSATELVVFKELNYTKYVSQSNLLELDMNISITCVPGLSRVGFSPSHVFQVHLVH